MSASPPASLLCCSLAEFLDRVAQRTPTPGGGSVAATAAALAAATARMVVAFAPGPQTPMEDRARLATLAEQLERCDLACRRLVDEDAAAFEALSSARQQVKQKEVSPQVVQEALHLAVCVPLAVAAMSLSVLRLLDQHKALFKQSLHSDLAVAAHLGVAACRSAGCTAAVNVLELDSADDRAHFYDQIGHYRESTERLAEQIVAFVSRAG